MESVLSSIEQFKKSKETLKTDNRIDIVHVEQLMENIESCFFAIANIINNDKDDMCLFMIKHCQLEILLMAVSNKIEKMLINIDDKDFHDKCIIHAITNNHTDSLDILLRQNSQSSWKHNIQHYVDFAFDNNFGNSLMTLVFVLQTHKDDDLQCLTKHMNTILRFDICVLIKILTPNVLERISFDYKTACLISHYYDSSKVDYILENYKGSRVTVDFDTLCFISTTSLNRMLKYDMILIDEDFVESLNRKISTIQLHIAKCFVENSKFLDVISKNGQLTIEQIKGLYSNIFEYFNKHEYDPLNMFKQYPIRSINDAVNLFRSLNISKVNVRKDPFILYDSRLDEYYAEIELKLNDLLFSFREQISLAICFLRSVNVLSLVITSDPNERNSYFITQGFCIQSSKYGKCNK